MGRANRVMPERMNLGSHHAFTMGEPMSKWAKPRYDTAGRRSVMGFPLPSWQRPFVWTETQCIRFMESAWLGLYLGTYTFNRSYKDPRVDGLLIDGQQRMFALQQYLGDGFPVFGYRWSEVTEVDRRVFENSTGFACYITETEDEAYLRSYYDMMNFGGTAHTEEQRASESR